MVAPAREQRDPRAPAGDHHQRRVDHGQAGEHHRGQDLGPAQLTRVGQRHDRRRDDEPDRAGSPRRRGRCAPARRGCTAGSRGRRRTCPAHSTASATSPSTSASTAVAAVVTAAHGRRRAVHVVHQVEGVHQPDDPEVGDHQVEQPARRTPTSRGPAPRARTRRANSTVSRKRGDSGDPVVEVPRHHMPKAQRDDRRQPRQLPAHREPAEDERGHHGRAAEVGRGRACALVADRLVVEPGAGGDRDGHRRGGEGGRQGQPEGQDQACLIRHRVPSSQRHAGIRRSRTEPRPSPRSLRITSRRMPARSQVGLQSEQPRSWWCRGSRRGHVLEARLVGLLVGHQHDLRVRPGRVADPVAPARAS